MTTATTTEPRRDSDTVHGLVGSPFPLVILRGDDRHNVCRTERELIRTLRFLRDCGLVRLEIMFVDEDDLRGDSVPANRKDQVHEPR